MRKVRILTVPGPDAPDDAQPEELGQMVDSGNGDPIGTTPLAVEMLENDPRQQFDKYAKGWSNGYIQTQAA